MTLLFDQNLSPRLVHRLKDMYVDSSHVSDCTMYGGITTASTRTQGQPMLPRAAVIATFTIVPRSPWPVMPGTLGGKVASRIKRR